MYEVRGHHDFPAVSRLDHNAKTKENSFEPVLVDFSEIKNECFSTKTIAERFENNLGAFEKRQEIKKEPKLIDVSADKLTS